MIFAADTQPAGSNIVKIPDLLLYILKQTRESGNYNAIFHGYGDKPCLDVFDIW